MALFEMGSVSIEVDEDGFMQEPDRWDKEVAAALATTEGVDSLGDDHWKLVEYLRNYYLQFGVAPMIRKLCKATGFKLTTAPAAGWVLTSNASGVGTWQPSGGGGSSYWSIDPRDNIYYGDGYVGIGHGSGQAVLYPLHVLGTAAVDGLKLGTSATPGHVLTADANGVGTWQAPAGGGSTLWESDDAQKRLCVERTTRRRDYA